MQWLLPIQKLELSNIQIGNPWGRSAEGANQQSKPLAPLSYFGTQFRMPSITLLFPALRVLDYNPNSGRLVLDMSPSQLACIKINVLQETIVNAIIYNQMSWFKSEFSKEEIRNGFQPIIENQTLILHCPAAVRNVNIFKEGAWKTFGPEDTIVGKRIRVAIGVQGVSFLTKPGDDSAWSGRCRIQHRILGIIAVKE